jgi:predicted GNAT family acetyltransferase
MKSLIKEPLLHFLVLAIGIFVLHSAVSHDDADADAKRIIVDQDSLLTFIQYRTKSFEAETAKQQLESFSDEELKKVIDDYVREEALYREARSLGLNRDDYVIKRRLIQKVDYIARGFAESFNEVTDEHVRKYFEENKNDYFIDPRITFTHVFFSSELHGQNVARMLAEQKLEELQRTHANFHDASKHGERFLYGMNYVERSELFVKSHFGPEMTGQLFDVEPKQGHWYGPFMSSYGAHLVMVTQNQPGRMPSLEEIHSRVEQEAKRALTQERSKDATQQIVDSYEVDIVYEKPGKKLAMRVNAGGNNE